MIGVMGCSNNLQRWWWFWWKHRQQWWHTCFNGDDRLFPRWQCWFWMNVDKVLQLEFI